MKRLFIYIFPILFLSFGSVDAFASTTEDQTTAANRLEKEIASVSPTSTGVTISVTGETAERFHIFSITGQLVKTIVVESSEVMNIELPRGCYIIKCAHWSKKVMVK